jgi:hypothetical protein
LGAELPAGMARPSILPRRILPECDCNPTGSAAKTRPRAMHKNPPCLG